MTSVEDGAAGASVASGRRRELAEFVRSRRARRSPADAGLPVAGTRRTPGLRREEVATLAHVSMTWYTWLEQGRQIRVSHQVLASLARALGLDPAETAHLYRLAGEVPPRTAPSAPVAVPPQHRLLLAHLDPNPAFIVDRRFDVLAVNRGFRAVFADLDPSGHLNMLWHTFTDPGLRALLPDWEREAAFTVALFRHQAGVHVEDPEIATLIADLAAASPDFDRLWRRRDVVPFVPVTRTIRHPVLGTVELEYVKLRPIGDETTVVAYLARAGSPLLARLQALVDGDAAEGPAGQARAAPPSTASTVPVT